MPHGRETSKMDIMIIFTFQYPSKMRLYNILFLLFAFSLAINAETTDSTNYVDSLQSNTNVNDSSLIIETFTDYPSEIDGGSCDYYLNQIDMDNNCFIMIFDFCQTAYVKINGIKERLCLTNYTQEKQEFANSNYCLTVNILTKKYEEYESTTFEGTITIDNRKGTSKTISILCKCGC